MHSPPNPSEPWDERYHAKLWQQVSAGNRDAIETLIRIYFYLVRSLVREQKRQCPLVDENDLRSAALEGLYETITKYDRSQGIEFPRYATKIIRWRLISAVRSQTGAHDGRSRRHEWVTFVRKSLAANLYREPTDLEIATYLGWTEDEVRNALLHTGTRRIDYAESAEQIPDDSRELSLIAEREALKQAFTQLSEADQKILQLFYIEDLSAREVSIRLGISVAAVLQRAKRARDRLKKLLKSN